MTYIVKGQALYNYLLSANIVLADALPLKLNENIDMSNKITQRIIGEYKNSILKF